MDFQSILQSLDNILRCNDLGVDAVNKILVEFMTKSVERNLLSVSEANRFLRHYGCQIHYMDLDDCLYKE
jgi:tRNA G26 N,N-dimethylase Trm1